MPEPKRRIVPLFIPNAGCEHDCVFCNQRVISNIPDAVTPDLIREMLKPLVRGGGEYAENVEPMASARELAFYGGSFTAIPIENQKALLEAAQPFLEFNPQNSIRVSTRPDCIDMQTVAMLKRYGVKTIELGAQSMCDDVLALTRRGHTSSDVIYASKYIKDVGIALILQMMTGLPGDTREKSLYTAERLIGLKPDGVRIYPAVVVKGTELFNMWRLGQYSEHSVEDAVELCAELCVRFEAENIPVIRLGLNPSDTLSSGDAAAGAYHPAFGELVYSKMYYNKAAARLKGIAPLSDVMVIVAKGNISKMVGHKRQNIHDLTKNFRLRTLNIVEADIKPGEIMIEITA